MKPDLNQEDVNIIRQSMKSAKGPDNFRNLFMYSPNGKRTRLSSSRCQRSQQKMRFCVSRDDMMAAHRVPPQMMGIMPSNVGGVGMWRRRVAYLHVSS